VPTAPRKARRKSNTKRSKARRTQAPIGLRKRILSKLGFKRSRSRDGQAPVSSPPGTLKSSISNIDLQVCSPSDRKPLIYRAVPSYPAHHVKSGSGRDEAPQTQPGKCKSICARAPGLPATWENAYKHLTWQRKASPFLSFSTNFDWALRWKDIYLDEGADSVRIFCFHTRNLETLIDATTLAKKLGLIGLPRVGTRHGYEYLVWGWIAGSECAGAYEFKRGTR